MLYPLHPIEIPATAYNKIRKLTSNIHECTCLRFKCLELRLLENISYRFQTQGWDLDPSLFYYKGQWVHYIDFSQPCQILLPSSCPFWRRFTVIPAIPWSVFIWDFIITWHPLLSWTFLMPSDSPVLPERYEGFWHSKFHMWWGLTLWQLPFPNPIPK